MNTKLFPHQPVLIMDDEEPVLMTLNGILKSSGITNIICLQDSRKLLDLCEEQKIGVILLDLTMPYMSGEELLPLIHLDYPDIPVIIITGDDELSSAVECMKMGAYDYLVKPIESNKLIATVRQALEIQELRNENVILKKHLISNEFEHPEAFSEIVTINSKFKSILLYVEAIACTPKSVLITGETGVGKELIARVIHTLSDCRGELVSVNVAGFDDNMFADTLFGHKKGAFTSADQSRKGLIEAAVNGTLFLDEIGDLSQTSQVKLLRLLETDEYLPLGLDAFKRSEARIIAATNINLIEALEEGTFRRDLYYRLQTHHIHLPSLVERLDDLPLLVDFLLKVRSAK